MTFELHPQLEADTLPVADLGLILVRLMNDKRFPWIILVPKRPNISELHELSPLDQTMLTFETSQIAKMLRSKTGATKVNIAAIGNMVPQLHIHVIARFESDAAWPKPVWGFGEAEPYEPTEADAFITDLVSQIEAA